MFAKMVIENKQLMDAIFGKFITVGQPRKVGIQYCQNNELRRSGTKSSFGEIGFLQVNLLEANDYDLSKKSQLRIPDYIPKYSFLALICLHCSKIKTGNPRVMT
jgi:hypothetical protein